MLFLLLTFLCFFLFRFIQGFDISSGDRQLLGFIPQLPVFCICCLFTGEQLRVSLSYAFSNIISEEPSPRLL